MSDPIALASSLPLPVPAGDDGLSRVASRKWSLNRRPSSPRDDSQPKDNVVPYQALPVQGPVITLNYTPAMEVLEPDHQRMQVCPIFVELKRLAGCVFPACVVLCRNTKLEQHKYC